MRTVALAGVVAAVTLLAPRAPLAAQEASRLTSRFAALAGADGLGGESVHLFAGVEGGVVGDRFGGIGILEGGSGKTFSSFFLALGPAMRLLHLKRLDVLAFAGPGVYGEIEPSGTRRWAGVAAGGLSARVPVWRLVLAANLSGWTGSFRGEGFPQDIDVEGARLAIGLGWGRGW